MDVVKQDDLVKSDGDEQIHPGKIIIDYSKTTIEINNSGILSVFADGTTDKVSSSKVMSRKGNYYKDNEREEIKSLFSLLINN